MARAYQRAYEALQEALDIKPSVETERLYREQLRDATVEFAPAPLKPAIQAEDGLDGKL